MTHTLYLLSMWLHVVAAAAWIGGMLFLVFVVIPVLRRPAMRNQASQLMSQTGRRLGLTTLVRADFWQSSFGRARSFSSEDGRRTISDGTVVSDGTSRATPNKLKRLSPVL